MAQKRKHPLLKGFERLNKEEERRLRKMTLREATKELESLLRLRERCRWMR